MVAPPSACTLRLGAGAAAGDCTAATGGRHAEPAAAGAAEAGRPRPAPVIVTVEAPVSADANDGDETKPDEPRNQQARDTGRG